MAQSNLQGLMNRGEQNFWCSAILWAFAKWEVENSFRAISNRMSIIEFVSVCLFFMFKVTSNDIDFSKLLHAGIESYSNTYLTSINCQSSRSVPFLNATRRLALGSFDSIHLFLHLRSLIPAFAKCYPSSFLAHLRTLYSSASIHPVQRTSSNCSSNI